jgi:GAF domain-containing protein
MDSAASEVRRLCGRLEHREISFPQFLESCARLIATAIGCSRAGIWVFEHSARGRSLRCLAMHDAVNERFVRVPDETGSSVSAYFRALEVTGCVVADDARTHPATAGFFAEHLQVSGVESLMAVAFSVNGEIYGAFTCTQVGRKREWTRAQLGSLRLMGSKLSLAIANAVRNSTDTQPAALANS